MRNISERRPIQGYHQFSDTKPCRQVLRDGSFPLLHSLEDRKNKLGHPTTLRQRQPKLQNFDSMTGNEERQRGDIGKVLRHRKDWRPWFTEIKTYAICSGVWEFMNPELDTQPNIPITIIDVSAPTHGQGTLASDLDLDRRSQAELLQTITLNYRRVFIAIKRSIDKTIADGLWMHKTPYKMLKALYQIYHRSDEQEQAILLANIARITIRGLGNKGLGAYLTEIHLLAMTAAQFPTPYPDSYYITQIGHAIDGKYPKLERAMAI
jgi:hypothetical protein